MEKNYLLIRLGIQDVSAKAEGESSHAKAKNWGYTEIFGELGELKCWVRSLDDRMYVLTLMY